MGSIKISRKNPNNNFPLEIRCTFDSSSSVAISLVCAEIRKYFEERNDQDPTKKVRCYSRESEIIIEEYYPGLYDHYGYSGKEEPDEVISRKKYLLKIRPNEIIAQFKPEKLITKEFGVFRN